MVTRADWQVRNSQRRYPIDEGASAVGDDGTVLPESFLVDANIWVPKYLYGGSNPLQFVYVSSAMVSSQLVSLTLLGCVDHLGAAQDFVPLGSVTLTKPVDAHRNYPIEPLLDGVMGWVSFGHFVAGEGSLFVAMSTPSQGSLAPKASRFYDYLPIPTAAPYESLSTVTGDVRIIADAPVTAELKDMRLYGELEDRKMLVIGLTQTEEVLSAFSGLCGKRPESGNCLKGPITSISGTKPDCTGNINIQFDSEILVRYFSNPLYPIPDPLPIRGGMCLDSVYSLNEACQKVRTLPDSSGLLPGAYTWVRPCDLDIPFSQPFNSADAFETVQISVGYAYLDGYDVYIAAGMGESAEAGPCFETLELEETATVRSHKVSFGDTPETAVVGMYAFDTINTRLLVTIERGTEPAGSEAGVWSVSKYNKGLRADDEVLDSGDWGDGEINSVSITAESDRSVTIKVNDTLLTSFVFASDDVYYDPSGKAGLYVGGSTKLSFAPKPSVLVSQYDVVDTTI